MCGITGFFGQGDEKNLIKMTRTLAHRGPDDEGHFFNGKVGLGHRRLSVIDLQSSGHQPMSNEDGSVWISFNGEIYNFQKIKKELENRHVFKGKSDTEAIVHLYEEIGERVFEKIHGMFAVAIYDKKKDKIFLARDRMGKKPLYWAIFGNTLIFGSELRAMMQHQLFQKELSLESLNKFLQYRYIPTPHTIFKNVYKLEPGHYLVYDGKTKEKKKYWEMAFSIPNDELRLKEAVSELDTKLSEAVKSRLMSDVPLGVFLSGGIDSSTVAYYAQKNSNDKIKTFSIAFKEDKYDESKYARHIAAFLGTEHHEQILSAKQALDLLPEVVEILDEPIADESIMPTYLLSRFTRQHVKVALGGDGGDELFCGYDTFVAHKIAKYFDIAPEISHKILGYFANIFSATSSNLNLNTRVKKFASDFKGKAIYRNQRWIGAINKAERAQLFTTDIRHELNSVNEFEDIDNYLNDFAGSSRSQEKFWQEIIYLYQRMYMMDDVLFKVDRASMHNSLEVRSPFLDVDVVDFANSLPIKWKLSGFKTKYVLKKLMDNKLPTEAVYRKKQGFSLPMGDWLKKEFRGFTEKTLSGKRIIDDGLFDHNYINLVLRNHISGGADNSKLIWTLLVFQLWKERWL